MNQEKLILFDLGGVVIDIDFGRIWKHWSEASGVDLSDAQETLGPASSDNDAFHRFEKGQISETEFYRLTSLRTGMQMSLEQWRAGWNAIFVGPMPGTLELLESLNGHVRLMALSNINAPHHAFMVKRFAHLLRHFDTLIYSHEVGMRKPDRAIFDLVIQRSSLPPENILFFDDMPSNVEGALRAGLRSKLFLSAQLAEREITRHLSA